MLAAATAARRHSLYIYRVPLVGVCLRNVERVRGVGHRSRELDSVTEFRLSGTIQLASASLAGRRPARELVAGHLRSGLRSGSSYLGVSRHVEIARTCLRQVGNQVCDQIADLLATC